ncbi:MAG: DUF1073 domain-containing protein [Elusimicrobiales bacterium]|nr:DUF1073 domain-containing protein [Elusimicrobiales bacterium]
MTAREGEKKEKRHNPYVKDFDIMPRLTEEQKKELLKLSFQRTAADFVPVDRDGKRKTAQDDAAIEGLKQMRMNGLEGAGQDKIYTFFGLHGFIGWQLCAVIAQHWAVNNACSIPAEDAARPGWENSLADADNDALETDPQEQSADIPARLKELSLQKYGLMQALIRHAKNMKIFGVSYLLPVFDGDYDYSKPYNPDGIQPGSFKGFKIIDPYWVMPQWERESMSNPASIHFYEPEFYCLPGGKNVHYTQILKAVNAEVPDILKPSYYFGGIPLTQMIYERVYAAEKVANEAPLMALTKRTSVLYTNLEEILAQPEIAAKNLTTIAKYRDNQGIMLQDQDSRYEQHDVSLADFDQLISMQYQLVAAVAKIPAEKLFKTPISGLGQTGAYAEHDYKQELQSLQERVYMPVVNRANEIIMRSDLERTEPITAAFNPVDMPTEKDKAEIQEIKARINTGYLTSGVITPEEARDALRNDKDSVYAGLTDEVPEDYGGENLPDNGNENEAQPPSGNSGGKEEEPIGKGHQDIFYHGQFHKYKISEEDLKKYNRPVPAHNGNTPEIKNAAKAQDYVPPDELEGCINVHGANVPLRKNQSNGESVKEFTTEKEEQRKVKKENKNTKKGTNIPNKKSLGKIYARGQELDYYYKADDSDFLKKLKHAPLTTISLIGSSKEAANTLKKIAGKDLQNDETGIKAQVNSKQRNKMMSGVAIAKSITNGFSRDEHLSVLTYIDKLFRYAILRLERSDGKGKIDISSIRRFVIPIQFGTGKKAKKAYAKLTVKEYVSRKKGSSGNKKLYTMELHTPEQVEKHSAGLDRK